MAVSMVNSVEFLHVVELLDRVAPPSVVDKAFRSVGLSRKILAELPDFLPYRLEASVVEHVARALGDRDLGARIAQEFDYAAYHAYARYVLGAPDLATALERGKRALPLIHPGSEIVLRQQDSHVIVGRKSDLNGMIGHRHLDDGAIIIILQVLRHFAGPDWRPAWIEVTNHGCTSATYLEKLAEAPVHGGADMPAIAVPVHELGAVNPNPPCAHQIVNFVELPALMGVRPLRTMADAVKQVLCTQLVLGDLSEESVASRLAIGRRTLQRALKHEGTSFREVKARFIETRARALLAESDLEISMIAEALGYDEPKSFRRAFRSWTNLTPNAYRVATCRG